MRRNSGIIGLHQFKNYKNTGLSGVFDLFDQQNIQKSSDWPETMKVETIDVSDTTPDEGTMVSFTVNTSGVLDGTILYYTIISYYGVSADDFGDGLMLGSFEITNNQGVVEKVLTGSATLTEPNDQFALQVRKDSTSGDILSTSSTVYIQDAIVTASWKSPSTSTSTNGASTANPVNIYYRRTVFKMTYSSSLMASMGGGGTINKLRTYVTNPLSSPRIPLPNYTVSLKNWNTPSSNPGNSGWTIVWNSTLSPTSVGYYEWDITDFAYSGGGLALCFAWGQCPYGWTADGQARTFSDSGDAYAWMSRSDGSGYYTNASSANSNYNSYVPVIELYF